MAAPPSAVYPVLADIWHYPTWWPQVPTVQPIDEHSAAAVIRSVLPYSLRVVLTRQLEDAANHTLRVGISGDMVGFAQFRVRGVGAGSLVEYRQEVDLRRPVLRALAPVLGSAMSWNHAVMMRAGQRGLRARVMHQTPPPGPTAMESGIGES